MVDAADPIATSGPHTLIKVVARTVCGLLLAPTIAIGSAAASPLPSATPSTPTQFETFVHSIDGSAIDAMRSAPRIGPRTSSSDAFNAPRTEIDALIEFFRATDGDRWDNNANWLTDGDVRTWHGVSTDAKGSITSIKLNDNNLRGILVPELAGLRNLRALDLSGNQMSGPIPPELGSLLHLDRLNLAGNNLSGQIPPELGRLENLYMLGLRGNALSGPVPSELSGMHKLSTLDLGNNALAGPIPAAIGSLTKLQELHLDSNQLSGQIPPEIAQLRQIQRFSVYKNSLSGPIPGGWQNLRSLEFLAVSENRLNGQIPPGLIGLPKLRHLYANGNLLTGQISPDWGRARALTHLDLSDNLLEGHIPPEISQMRSLQSLELSNNNLSGPIPESISELTDLGKLQLAGNRLTGGIPTGIGDLERLWSLDLSRNQLSGQFPSSLGGLARLRELYLYSNTLSGPIPPDLAELPDFVEIRIWGNDWVGCIPRALQRLSSELGSLAIPYCAPGLTSLSFDRGAIEPRFDPSGYEYTLRVGPGADLITVKAIAAHGSVEFLDAGGDPMRDVDQTAPGQQIALTAPRQLLQVRVYSPDRTDRDIYSITIERGFEGRLQVLANQYVEAPGNADLRHNLSDFEIEIRDRIYRADFLSHYLATGGLERWGYPTSEVLMLDDQTLTQFYQRGVVDFHDLGSGWILERRLAWDYIGGGALGSTDQGFEPGITNPHPGSFSGPWGHKISNLAIDGTEVGFLDFYRRLGGVESFGFPKTDAREDILAPGRLRDPSLTPGVIRQYFQGAVFEFHPGDPNEPVKLSLIGDALRNRLVPGHRFEAAFSAAAEIKAGVAFNPLVIVESDHVPLASSSAASDISVLIDFYNAYSGHSWRGNTYWLQDEPVERWYGVRTSPSGRVVELNLSNIGLEGPIPPELGRLTALRRLDLGGNELTGTIPIQFAQLTELTELDLSSNQLTGLIPAQLSRLENLSSLDLGWNNLSGSIPPGFGSLTELQMLNLGNNQLSGPIPPEIGDLSKMESLRLAWNQLNGPIPAEIFALQRLRKLDFRQNLLAGSIPRQIGQLRDVQYLALSNNQLEGPLPTELGLLERLRYLDLSWNKLTGPIPAQFTNLKLRVLRLSSNGLAGKIPPELGSTLTLEELRLESNQLTGPIPPELGQLESLTYLSLHGNELSGEIPPELRGLRNVRETRNWRQQSDRATAQVAGELNSARIPDLIRESLIRSYSAGTGPIGIPHLPRPEWKRVNRRNPTGASWIAKRDEIRNWRTTI